MYTRLKYLLGSILLLVGQLGFAQGQAVEMADTFRAEGKIYVVVLVAGIVFAGIVIYLIIIDRRLKKLEKEIEK